MNSCLGGVRATAAAPGAFTLLSALCGVRRRPGRCLGLPSRQTPPQRIAAHASAGARCSPAGPRETLGLFANRPSVVPQNPFAAPSLYYSASVTCQGQEFNPDRSRWHYAVCAAILQWKGADAASRHPRGDRDDARKPLSNGKPQTPWNRPRARTRGEYAGHRAIARALSKLSLPRRPSRAIFSPRDRVRPAGGGVHAHGATLKPLLRRRFCRSGSTQGAGLRSRA